MTIHKIATDVDGVRLDVWDGEAGGPFVLTLYDRNDSSRSIELSRSDGFALATIVGPPASEASTVASRVAHSAGRYSIVEAMEGLANVGFCRRPGGPWQACAVRGDGKTLELESAELHVLLDSVCDFAKRAP